MTIELDAVTSGYNLSVINKNFQTIEDKMNAEVLWRKNSSVAGEAKMERDLDMDSNNILNAMVGDIPLSEIAEQTKAVYEALANGGYGYVTVDSFEDGYTLLYPNQVLRWEANGEYYRWDGGLDTFPKVVPPSSTPNTTGGIGLGKWVGVGDASLRPLVEVTANVVGSNNYTLLPAIGGTVVAGNDYLYQNVLYTTRGVGGTILSISDGVITTSGGSLYLLDKRWPVNDVRAWGVRNNVQADTYFKRAADFLVKSSTDPRSLYVPPIFLLLGSVELRDMANFEIHFDGTYILGNATTAKTSVIDVVNATFFKFTGKPMLEAVTSNYEYGITYNAGLPSAIAPLTGLLTNVHSDLMQIRKFPCAVRVGDGSDLQISEIHLNLQTNRCNAALEAKGSQVIVNVTGNLMCEPQTGFTYPEGCIRAIGATVYHTGGEAVTSVGSAASAVARVSQISSSLYGNPFGSVKFDGVHVEGSGFLMVAENGSGIVGPSDSGYSCVSFSNCQGSLLQGGNTLINIGVSDYSGTFSADANCNFYTSSTRTAKIVFSNSPTFNFDVSPRAFRKGFATLSQEIGSGNVNWIHDLQPIINMTVNPVTIPNNSSAPLGFSTRASTGDYQFYYGDTSSGGIVTAHKFDCLFVNIAVLSSAALTIALNINGTEYFSCQNGGTVIIPREKLAVGTVIEFVAKNSSGSSVTTNATSRIMVSGSNRD